MKELDDLRIDDLVVADGPREVPAVDRQIGHHLGDVVLGRHVAVGEVDDGIERSRPDRGARLLRRLIPR